MAAKELAWDEQADRQRLADELHDGLQQLLVATLYATRRMRSRDAQPAILDGARKIEELMDQAITESRRLAGELCPPPVRESGLMDSLQWLIDHQWAGDRNVSLSGTVRDEPSAPQRGVLVQVMRGVLAWPLWQGHDVEVEVWSAEDGSSVVEVRSPRIDAEVNRDQWAQRVAQVRRRMLCLGGEVSFSDNGGNLALTITCPTE